MERRRFDRILPWAAFGVMSALLLMGITWNASFEATPANTDLVSQGDDRLRELKLEIRNRMEYEHCFGSGGGSGCSTDIGAHRNGSASIFVQNAAPTALLNPAATALGSNQAGRMWSDSDGLVGGTHDDRTLNVWDGATWNIARAQAIEIPGAAVNAATITDNQIFDIGTIDAAPATLVMAGGAGAGGIPMVTVPATGTWDIVVRGNFAVNYSGVVAALNPRVIVFRLQEQIAAGAFAVVAWCSMMTDTASADDEMLGACTYAYSRAGTASTAYSYRIRVSTFTPTSETDDIIVESTSTNHDVEAETPNTGYLRAELTQRGA